MTNTKETRLVQIGTKRIKVKVKHKRDPTEDIYRGCLNKSKYSSLMKAEEAAARHNLRVYLCKYCREYHLTSLK